MHLLFNFNAVSSKTLTNNCYLSDFIVLDRFLVTEHKQYKIVGFFTGKMLANMDTNFFQHFTIACGRFTGMYYVVVPAFN